MMGRYLPGALVTARGRDWVVLPADEADVVRMRPVDGSDEDTIGVFLPLEKDAIEHSQYRPPEPTSAGDFTGALLLRDAVRLSLRSGAGPFRSMGRVIVGPRPYQFVPLIMALRLNPIRLLIADDVGVGKTIEAGMIARELLDRGVIRRIGVVCAPHLCDQVWEKELREKFNIETAVIQPSRMARLERDLPRADIGVFQHYRHLVASIDFVKSERYRGAFIDNAPDLIIIDEAHTAARPRGDRTSVQHQRYELIRELADNPDRHIILTTATPHSGIEESFRSLLGLLDPQFDTEKEIDLPRRKLVPHLVQRRRADLQNWLGEDTPFPDRDPTERTYQILPDYLKLFEDVLAYCRESVSTGTDMRQQQQRVRYWAAIAILRCLLSSPDAATAMLEKRARRKQDGARSPEEAEPDAIFGPQVLDSAEEEEPSDYVPTAPLDDPAAALKDSELRRLDGFLKRAQALRGQQLDAKLAEAAKAVSELLSEGFSPIVYCRFIATAKYVAEQLQVLLHPKHPEVRVVSVSGDDGDSEQRSEMVEDLAKEPVRVLVATDCLSEGINLQESFDAVLHYDLPWNPNRLEQREGRVDRYGQKKKKVKTVLLYGSNNEIDLVVLDVLIRKARTIRNRLGISVPVPVESEHVVQAVVDSVLLRRAERGPQLQLALEIPEVSAFHAEWEKAADREGQARTYFAQQGIKPDEVARELKEMEPALGSADDVRSFVANALQRFNGELRQTRRAGVFELHPGDLREQMHLRAPYVKSFPLRVAFDGVPPGGVRLLGRNHPIVNALTDAVLAKALAGDDRQFSRCGAIYTDIVQVRTGIAVVRLRYLLEDVAQQFAEEVVVAAFRRGEDGVEWLKPTLSEGLRLLKEAKPVANMPQQERERQVAWALGMLDGRWYQEIIGERVRVLEDSHTRLRALVKTKSLKVTAHEPPDVLGCYVLVPAGGKA